MLEGTRHISLRGFTFSRSTYPAGQLCIVTVGLWLFITYSTLPRLLRTVNSSWGFLRWKTVRCCGRPAATFRMSSSCVIWSPRQLSEAPVTVSLESSHGFQYGTMGGHFMRQATPSRWAPLLYALMVIAKINIQLLPQTPPYLVKNNRQAQFSVPFPSSIRVGPPCYITIPVAPSQKGSNSRGTLLT